MKQMKDLRWRLLLLFVPLAFLVSCDDDDDNDIGLDRMTSAEFVQRAAASDMFEIETGNMAVQKSTMEEVQEFGQELVEDHTMTSQELMTLAQQKNLQVPTTLPEDKRNTANRLAALQGTEFDKEFANVQVAAHEEAIDLYEQASDELEDVDLRSFAQRTLPALRMHLEHARALKTQTDQL